MSLTHIREDVTPSDQPFLFLMQPDGTTIEYGCSAPVDFDEPSTTVTEVRRHEFGCLALEIPMEHRTINTDIQDPYTKKLQESKWAGIHFNGGREDIRRIPADAVKVCNFLQTLDAPPPYVVGVTHQDAARMAGRFGMRVHEVALAEDLVFDDLEFMFECGRDLTRPGQPIPPMELCVVSLPTRDFIRHVLASFT